MYEKWPDANFFICMFFMAISYVIKQTQQIHQESRYVIALPESTFVQPLTTDHLHENMEHILQRNVFLLKVFYSLNKVYFCATWINYYVITMTQYIYQE